MLNKWNVLHAKNTQSWQSTNDGNLRNLFEVINRNTGIASYIFSLNNFK